MEIDKAEANGAILQQWSDINIKKLAPSITTQEHAADLRIAIRDESKALQPEVCPMHSPYLWAKATAVTCGALVLATFIVVFFWPDAIVGAKLCAALGLVGVAITAGAFATFRARAIRLQDAQMPSVVNGEHVDEAAFFVRLFGAVVPSDSAGMFILALSGGADAALAGWVVATGMAGALSVIAVLAVSTVVATLFSLALRILAGAFTGCCASIRAKLLVRRLAQMDFNRYPETLHELAFAEVKLGPLTGHSFAKPKAIEYAAAAGVLFAVPCVFVLLLLFRVYVANQDGAAALHLILGVSALFAALAILGAAIAGIRGHLLPDEGRFQSVLHRRFPTRAAFESWLAAHSRWTRRWANNVARRLNDEIQKSAASGDRRCMQRTIVVPRPYPDVEADTVGELPQPAHDTRVQEPRVALRAIDVSAVATKDFT